MIMMEFFAAAQRWKLATQVVKCYNVEIYGHTFNDIDFEIVKISLHHTQAGPKSHMGLYVYEIITTTVTKWR